MYKNYKLFSNVSVKLNLEEVIGSVNCLIKGVMDFVTLPITMTIVDMMEVIAVITPMKAGTSDVRFHGIKE